jgi:hypothetical protein
MRTILVAVVLLPALAAAEPPYQVFFTGRLLGHARVPSHQNILTRDCTAALWDQGSAAAQRIRELTPDGAHLLLGLGDNFAPEYDARVVERTAGTGGSALLAAGRTAFPKDQLVWTAGGYVDLSLSTVPRVRDALRKFDQDSGAPGLGTVPFDNVGCFLALAGYAALVPGRHDFYFGAERLRELAAYMDAIGGPRLLAANLHVVASFNKPPADWRPPGAAAAAITLPRLVYPWLPVAVGKDLRDGKVRLCESYPLEPARIRQEGCRELEVRDGSRILLPPGSLQDGLSYGLCTATACKTFTVARPLFRLGGWAQGKGRTPPPFYFHAATGTAVFGVVASSTGAQIGALNLSWRNGDDIEARVLFGSEEEALDQALLACEYDAVCGQARHRVLLAQMSEERAGELARRFGNRFDVVLAEANLHGPTPEQVVRRKREDQQARSFVFTPGTIYDSRYPEQLQVSLHHVAIAEEPGGIVATTHEMLRDQTRKTPFAPLQDEMGYSRKRLYAKGMEQGVRSFAALAEESVRNLLHVEAKGEDAARLAILETLRRECRADAAFIQKNDTFRLKQALLIPYSADILSELLNRTLWKGDLLVAQPVKGAVLQQVMELSRTWERRDIDPFSLPSEKERQLLTIGIDYDDASAKWYVNGAPLDPNRLYTVATTDFIAFGDTDYPMLKSADGLQAPRLRDRKVLTPLTSVVCRALLAGDPALCPAARLETDYYLDSINILPANARQLPGAWEVAEARTRDALVPHDPLRGAAPASVRVQRRPVSSFTLEKLEGSYNQYVHNRASESSLASQFGGLTSPEQALSTENNTITLNTRLRARRTWGRVDAFALGEEYLSRLRKRDKTNLFSTNMRQNVWGVESGLNARLFYVGARRPEWLAIASVRYETSILNPPTSFVSGGATYTGTLEKTSSATVKWGLRWQGASSWLETGIHHGRRFHVPDRLQADPLRGLRASYVTRPRDGNFLNFHLEWAVPYLKPVSYVMENRGEFNWDRAGDLTTETRLYTVWSNALQISLYKNISLAPKLEYFYFQNKVARASVTGVTASLALIYQFEWRPGLPWPKALIYPYPLK